MLKRIARIVSSAPRRERLNPLRSLACAALFGACASAAAAVPRYAPAITDVDGLEATFASPERQHKPLVFWFWQNRFVSKEGITEDLETMAGEGVGGATLFHKFHGGPSGDVRFFSDQYVAMFQHAVEEADRLGLEIGFFNSDGHSQSGGPWIEPKNAMKRLVWRRVEADSVDGGVRAHVPRSDAVREGYYRDVRVLAFPRTYERPALLEGSPDLSAAGGDAALLVDGDPKTWIPLKASGPVRFRSEKAIRPERLFVSFPQAPVPPGGGDKIPQLKGNASVQGRVLARSGANGTFEKIGEFSVEKGSFETQPIKVELDSDEAREFKIGLEFADGASAWAVSEMVLLQKGESAPWQPDIPWLLAKSSSASWRHGMFTAPAEAPLRRDVLRRDQIRDVTDHLDGDMLHWPGAPEGEWTLVRFGYSLTGARNHPATPEGEGYETDKLRAAATEAHFENFVKPMAKAGQAVSDDALTHVELDSWEMRFQNWTQGFGDAFKRRRGYALTPFLATLAGEVVEDRRTTERFLLDFRRTISEMIAGNYFGRMTELAHTVDLEVVSEGIYNWNRHPATDVLANWGAVDIPAGEFWYDWSINQRGSRRSAPTYDFASAAHAYGAPFAAAEAFTSYTDRWRTGPAELKDVGDQAFARGINRYQLHCSTHQPKDRMPGYFGRESRKFHRNNPWWRMARGWLGYVGRSQAMLQAGRFHADVAYFYGEQVPTNYGLHADTRRPDGYRGDVINPEILMEHAAVENGRLVLDSGAAYAVLVLPDRPTMMPEHARQIRRFVHQGLTVVGPPPSRSPSLENQPEADRAVQSIARELWGDTSVDTPFERSFGQGRIVWGTPLPQVLQNLGLPRAFAFESPAPDANLVFLERRLEDGTSVFFVANLRNASTYAECRFRASGRPEIWLPESGREHVRALYQTHDDGRVSMPLFFGPRESKFVVFEGRTTPPPEAVSLALDDDGVFPLERGTDMPPHEFALNRGPEGPVLETLGDGSFSIQTPEGTRRRVEIDAGEPVAPSGPWKLRLDSWFDEPTQTTTMSELVSLTETEQGRGFAGTITYRNSFDLKARDLKRHAEWILSLNEVHLVAEVTVNGERVGNAWMPPHAFRVGEFLRAGENTVEVRVINSLANRIMADLEKPPEEREVWTPAPGVLENAYANDATPPKSGLVGPVRLHPVSQAKLDN